MRALDELRPLADIPLEVDTRLECRGMTVDSCLPSKRGVSFDPIEPPATTSISKWVGNS